MDRKRQRSSEDHYDEEFDFSYFEGPEDRSIDTSDQRDPRAFKTEYKPKVACAPGRHDFRAFSVGTRDRKTLNMTCTKCGRNRK